MIYDLSLIKGKLQIMINNMITYTIALVITSYPSSATYNMGEITGKLIIVINNRITYPFEITSFNMQCFL